MGYVLVSVNDKSKELSLNYRTWGNLRLLLIGTGWRPMGAIGHWDYDCDERILQPLNTDHERFKSYDGCCFQLVREDDARNMLEAARWGISLCKTDPDGTFKIVQKLNEGYSASEKEATTVGEACDYVRGLLKDFVEFANDGAFIIQ